MIDRRLPEAQLALVTDVQDPDRRGRVQLRLLAVDGPDGQDAPVWARVALPFAGPDRGAFFFPDVGDEVLVTFIGGDPRFPVVVGSLYNGSTPLPDALGGDRVDRWTLTGRHGSRIAIVEAQLGQAKVTLSTPGGVSVTLHEEGGGRVQIEAAGSRVTVDSEGVSVEASAKVTVSAAQVEVNSGQVTVNAAMTTCSGVLKCDTLMATTVVASVYTPGAGNVW